MRKISTIFIILLLGIVSLFGQTSLSISGDVIYSGNGLPNQEVYLSIISGQNGGYSLDDTTFTDSSGLFSFSPILDAGITNATIQVYTLDCTGNFYAADSGFFTGANVNFNFSISYCPPNVCHASFTTTTTSGTNTAQFINSSYGNYLYYTWDFGDGEDSHLENPSHTYSQFGTYYVCLNIYDSVNTTCSDFICDSVTVNGPAACNASFSQTVNGMDIQLTNNSSGSVGTSFSYLWDFGDGSTSTLENPSYTYSTPGFYSVCLTISDTALNCTDDRCKTLTIQNIGTYIVQGRVVNPDTNSFSHSIAYLIVHDSLSGTLTAIDSVITDQSPYSGRFRFINVSPGTYYVKAALLPNDPDYTNFLPTYFEEELYWSNATPVVVTNSNVYLDYLFLTQGNNPGGPGFIGGLISQGANKGPGDPLANISVLLSDDNDNPIAYTFTDINGEYGFSNLALGSYEVHVEIPGKESISWLVTLSNDSSSFNVAHFEVGDSTIKPVNTTAVEDFSFGKIISVYPNPTSGQLFVDIEIAKQASVNLELINSIGQTLQLQKLLPFSGRKTMDLQIEDLPTGTYLLKISSGSQITTKTIIKR